MFIQSFADVPRVFGKVECYIGRYVALASNERIKSSLGPADFLHKCRQVHIHGFEKFLGKLVSPKTLTQNDERLLLST